MRKHKQTGIRHSQRGVALLTAMLLMVLIGILAADLAWDTRIDIRRTENLINADRAMMYAMGAEAWAAEELRKDALDSDNDHLGENWATPVPTLPIDGGAIQGFVEDLQGRFNVNNLVIENGTVNPVTKSQLERLLKVLDLDTGLASSIADWIDDDIEPGFPDGAEDGTYTAKTPPYRTANTSLTNISELLAMNGMDAEIYAVLAPHIIALPRGTHINVNTASIPILRSLSDDISDTEAENLIGERGDQGFETLAAFEDLVDGDVMQNIDLTSRFFRVTADVSIGSTRFTMYSLLEREDAHAVPVMRTFNSE